MKNKTFILLIILLAISIWACENEPAGFYEGKQSVYFPAFTINADSTVFSFLGSVRDVDTVFLDVKLLGYASPEVQRMAIRVIPEKTTAVEGVHFESIRQFYEFPPNRYDYKLPIVLKNHPDLDEATLALAIEIIDSEDLEVAFEDKSTARIVFSNIVMKPTIWDQYLAPWFGAYSRIKHIVCMEIMGQAFPQTVQEFNAERNMWRNFGWICNNHFRDNIVMDTDVTPPVRILPWF
jgi:hypothetical protein